jgi:hypothetical protein
VVRLLRSICNEDTNQFPLYISQSYAAEKGLCNCTGKASTLTICKKRIRALTCRLPLYKLQINDNIKIQYNVMFLIKVIGEN